MIKQFLFILLFVFTSSIARSECDSISFKKDVDAILNYAKYNLDDKVINDDYLYYQNFKIVLYALESNIIKYKDCENQFYHKASIFLFKNFLFALQVKSKVKSTEKRICFFSNTFLISPDSVEFHANFVSNGYLYYTKRVKDGIFRYSFIDDRNCNGKYVSKNDSTEGSTAFENYFEKKFKFFWLGSDKSILDNLSYVREVETTLAFEKTKKILTSVVIVSILFLISIITIFFFYKKMRKQKQLIDSIKTHLEEKNKEVTDSINYSKRIQQAILPDLNEIKNELKDSFVFYQPKDIVSGDFYYFNKIDNDVFIAAADCTGHGVPGAFMSLIGSKELKIANSLSSFPSKILQHLNVGVKETLKQNHIDGTKDGMDIALIKINKNNICYSAANRPLWILKNGTNEIIEIKATKAAIAGFTDSNQVFEEHNIELNSGDSIYMFTDGIPDQFGGEKEKKLTTKRVKEFLLSIANLPMVDQKELIQKFISDWKKTTEQVDDMLIIGIRI